MRVIFRCFASLYNYCWGLCSGKGILGLTISTVLISTQEDINKILRKLVF